MQKIGKVAHRVTHEVRDLVEVAGGVKVAHNPQTGRADRYVSGGEWSRADSRAQSAAPGQLVAPTQASGRHTLPSASNDVQGAGSAVTNAYIRYGSRMTQAMNELRAKLPTEMHRVESYIESVSFTPESALEVAENLNRYNGRTLDTQLNLSGF